MKKTWLIFGALLFLGAFLFGCTSANQPQTSSSGIAQATIPQLQSSIEQENIKARLEIVNNPATVMWFYGLSDAGTMIFKSAVKGKVTSSGKRLEQTDITCLGEYGTCSHEILQADGTYGSSDEYVYWFDYEGNYFQWNGKYILATKPLRIPAPMIDFQQRNQSD